MEYKEKVLCTYCGVKVGELWTAEEENKVIPYTNMDSYNGRVTCRTCTEQLYIQERGRNG